MAQVQQDPWEEQMQPFRPAGSGTIGGIVKLIKKAMMSAALGSMGAGATATNVMMTGGLGLLQDEIMNRISPSGPGGTEATRAAVTQGVTGDVGSIRMPWEQDNQKTMDSYSGFFEKLDNPNLTNTFQQLLKVLHPPQRR